MLHTRHSQMHKAVKGTPNAASLTKQLTVTNLSGGVLAQCFLITILRQLDLTQYSCTLARRRHQQRLTSLHTNTPHTTSLNTITHHAHQYTAPSVDTLSLDAGRFRRINVTPLSPSHSRSGGRVTAPIVSRKHIMRRGSVESM